MYETIRVINGYAIYRMVGTHGVYHVRIESHRFATFNTIKAAVAFIGTL